MTQQDKPAGSETKQQNLPVLSLTPQEGESIQAQLARREPEKLAQAREMAGGLDVANSQAVLTFGVNAQTQLVHFTDQVLTNVRSGEAGPAGQLMADLKGKILQIDVRSIPRTPAGRFVKFIQHIPLIGGPLARLLNKGLAFMRRFETLESQIDDIVKSLDAERANQLEHMNRLESLHQRNDEYFDQLEIVIAAGEIKLEQMRMEFESRRDDLAAEVNPDPRDLQALKDFADLIASFDRRIYNLRLARTSALTSGPTIRVAQQGAKSIVELVQDSILLMVPEWKKQVVLSVALFDQKKAMALVNEARATTNQLMLSTADLLSETQTAVKQAQGEGFVKVDTLVQVTDKLIQTIDQGIQMDVENKKKRAEGIEQLNQAEAKLKDALKEAQSTMNV